MIVAIELKMKSNGRTIKLKRSIINPFQRQKIPISYKFFNSLPFSYFWTIKFRIVSKLNNMMLMILQVLKNSLFSVSQKAIKIDRIKMRIIIWIMLIKYQIMSNIGGRKIPFVLSNLFLIKFIQFSYLRSSQNKGASGI